MTFFKKKDKTFVVKLRKIFLYTHNTLPNTSRNTSSNLLIFLEYFFFCAFATTQQIFFSMNASAMAMFSFSSYLFTSYAGCYFRDFSMIVNGHETSKTYKMNDVEYPRYLYRNYGPNHLQVNNRIS